ncbi:MAG: FtsW/RodA/SpoVE family cell cycle protein [Phycisphaeraceae bacterium]|nr:FtsW/RodA/SpoVE family cell cycle protein [Phycisphaeraceae bacterium]
MLRAGHMIALSVLGLLAIGLVMVTSAGMSVGQAEPVTLESVLLSRTSAYAALSLLAMAGAALLPVRLVAREPAPDAEEEATGRFEGLPVLCAGAVLLMGVALLVYVPGLGRHINQSSRWVAVDVPAVGQVSAQPSEIAKWGLIGLLSWGIVRRRRYMRSFVWGLMPLLGIAGALSAVVALEDLGTGVLMGATSAVLLLAGGARFIQLAALAPVVAACGAPLVLSESYRLQRLRTFFESPYLDPQGTGYHMIQSMATIAGGEGWGRGLGNGLQKFGYLPEDTTDFLFAVLSEELGIAGAAMVVFLYLTILWAGWAVIRREPNAWMRLIALGVIMTVGLQAMINLLVVTGWAPTKGIPLPLLSSGGTGWILTAASLGLVIAIDRTQPGRAHDSDTVSPDEEAFAAVEIAPA